MVIELKTEFIFYNPRENKEITQPIITKIGK